MGFRISQGLDTAVRRARVAIEHRNAYILYDGDVDFHATLAGRLRYEARSREDLPAVGDWVLVRDTVIEEVLARQTAFVRKAPGTGTEPQVIAANVDTVFLVCGLDGDFNPRRIERYCTVIRASGARAVVLLNKADLESDVEARIAQARASAPGIEVHAVSALAVTNLESLKTYLVPEETVAFVGSSGAGKSTLINRLLGKPKQATQEVRESDSRGRHTTTHRELIRMEGGTMLIDTPGLRELQLWLGEQDVGRAFEDIESLAERCRFRDCSHSHEEDCAVQAALVSGALDLGRFESYLKLRREAAYLDRQVDIRAALEEKARWKKIHKAMRGPQKRT